MKRGMHLSDARVPIMHASAIVVSGATTGDRSAGAHSASAATRSAHTCACGVSAAKTATTTEYAFVTSCPASVNQGDRCDAS